MAEVKIIMDNIYAQIVGVDPGTEDVIWNELSFEQGEFGTDNITRRHLYSKKTKKTYTGLIPYVQRILNERGITNEVVDTRIVPEKNADFKIQDGFDPRPYQQVIIDGATERETIQAATGAGKTFIMANLIAKYQVKPVFVFADKLSLVTQIRDEFSKFLGEEIGIIGGGQREIKDITICSVQSMVNEQELLKEAKMIMFDECMKYDTEVLMEDGTTEKIGKLVDEKSTKKVMSYNHKTNKLEPKKIISHSKTLLKKNNKKLMKLTIKKSDGTLETIECTDNHKIWIESLSKYVKAGELVKGQKVKTLKGNKND